MLVYEDEDDDLDNFEKSAAIIKTLQTKPTSDELLLLYALYKQAKIGQNRTDKPSMLDLKETYKWNAWTFQGFKSKKNARAEYIILVNNLMSKYQ